MKKLLLLLAVANIFAVGCQNDNTSDNAVNVSDGTTLTISLPQTRTSLGGKVGDTYPVYWSEGDKIVVNGTLSEEVKINSEDKTLASFGFSNGLPSTPYHITLPYCSATSAEQPVVEFPAEQEYTEGTYAVGSVPMCGYLAGGNNRITLNHLATILRVPVKAKFDGAILEKVVLTAENSVAGEYNVNCQNVAITATESVGNVVTYTLPANFTLSSSTESVLHIVLPAVEVGACTIEFIEKGGEKMVATWTPEGSLPKGVVREFKTVTYAPKTTTVLTSFEAVADGFEIFYKNIKGYVRYTDGSPIAGVAMSDGFQVVTTDENGYYELSGVTPETWYIYCSLPNDVVVPIDELGRPGFFKKYPSNTNQYDFTFNRIAKEEAFSLFVIADTHGNSNTAINRLKVECVGGIKAEKQRKGSMPCYSIICGDIVCATYLHTVKESAQQLVCMDKMIDTFSPKNTGDVPTFYVMGNHDYYIWDFQCMKYNTLELLNYHAQDAYEAHFGPANYSFNRGDTHIVCMRDILWPQSCIDNRTSADCYCGFMDYQVEWLRQDLANVPKSNKVILCVHIPLVEYYHSTSEKYVNANIKEVVDMISEYAESQILSGHTHENRDYKVGSTNYTSYTSPVNEKTILGNWSRGDAVTEYGFEEKLAGDGSPYGFDVYDVAGAAFTNHYFVDCTSNKSHNVDTDYVMRLYISSDVYGGDSTGDGKVYSNSSHASHERYFKFYDVTAYNSQNELRYDTFFHVNIFNGSPDTWSVKLYVDGAYVKDLAWRKENHSNGWEDESPTAFLWSANGAGTADDPWVPGSSNSQDWWYISYVVNETGGTSSQTTNGKCHHKWYGYIPVAHIEDIKAGNFYIEATHTEFGQTKVYRTNKIFGPKDYNGYANYLPKNE